MVNDSINNKYIVGWIAIINETGWNKVKIFKEEIMGIRDSQRKNKVNVIRNIEKNI